MLCRMPPVGLPDDLSQQLYDSDTGTISGTQGPGVAVFWAEDGLTRADIYVGFVFDGYQLLSRDPRHNSGRNRRSLEEEKMQFSIPPDLHCSPEDELQFAPGKDKVISIEVNPSYNVRVSGYIVNKRLGYRLQ